MPPSHGPSASALQSVIPATVATSRSPLPRWRGVWCLLALLLVLAGRTQLGAAAAGSADFVAVDNTTQGEWSAAYGAFADVVADTSQQLPASVSVVSSGTPYLWQATTSDPRALLAAASAHAQRTASCWYDASGFTIDVAVADGLPHQLALYVLDWDHSGRSETITVVDPGTGDVLDVQDLSDFAQGEYVRWTISGHVQLRITCTSGSGTNAVASGVFLDGPVPAAFVITDTDILPDYGAVPTIASIASGSWSSPSTWSTGAVPATGDVVLIAGATTVSYDVALPVQLATVKVDAGGELDVRPDISTHLLLANLLVAQGGTLTIGTAAAPVVPTATATIEFADQPIDTLFDPSQYGTGFLCLGRCTVHGAAKTPTFVRLAREPRAGDSTLALSAAVSGWRPGDRLVIPDSRHLTQTEVNGPYQWEAVTLSAVSADGRTVSLASPLAFDHLGARDVAGQLRFLCHVANCTRNVIFTSQHPAGTRGHVLITHRADADIENACFLQLGRTTNQPLDSTTYAADGTVSHLGTNQIGRYALHAHHLIGTLPARTDGHQFWFVGNCIDNGDADTQIKWGIDIHDSHFGEISDNVVYNEAGAGISCETGNETQNVFERNFVLRIRGSGNRQNDGTDGVAMWFHGPDNQVRDNVTADIDSLVYSYGYTVTPVYLSAVAIPLTPGADPNQAGQFAIVNMNARPLREFARNEAYSCSNGMSFWWINASYRTAESGGDSVIEGLSIWNCRTWGIFCYESSQMTISNLTIIDDKQVATNGYEECTGLWSSDYQEQNFTIDHADIEGANLAIYAAFDATGTQTIRNSIFKCRTDVVYSTPQSDNGGGGLPAVKLELVNDRFGSIDVIPPSQQTAIAVAYTPQNALGAFNFVTPDQLLVMDFNQVAGDDFQVFYPQQAATAIVPVTSGETIGAPLAGLTNQQCWDAYNPDGSLKTDASQPGMAIAGEMLPAGSATREGVSGGLVVALSSPPSDQPAVVVITGPGPGTTVSALVAVPLAITDRNPLTRVVLTCDGAVPAVDLAQAPSAFSWDSTTVPNGTHWLTAKVYDALGHVGVSQPIALLVANQVASGGSGTGSTSGSTTASGSTTSAASGTASAGAGTSTAAGGGSGSPSATAAGGVGGSANGGGSGCGLGSGMASMLGLGVVWMAWRRRHLLRG